MAGPIAHILLAMAVLQILPDKNQDEFLLGTSFPDIRYLKVISREQTHNNSVTWRDIINEPSSFKAGMLLHALVDRERQLYMAKHEVYDFIPKTRYCSHALKLFEDKLLYEKISDYNVTWQQVTNCFNNICPEEETFNIKKRHLWLWHTFLKLYCRYPGTMRFMNRFAGSIPLIHSAASTEIMQLMLQFQKNEKLKTVIVDFYQYFKEKIKQHYGIAITCNIAALQPTGS
ncbi:hypothetical protein KC460_03095 [Candidatus Dependentiae bacterium]|nr:hypothetical protein [Candidatus Dependentiae bacterium]